MQALNITYVFLIIVIIISLFYSNGVVAWIPNRHCERLQGAWQSRKNSKKCYKLAFFNWIASSKLTVFFRNDGINPRNNAYITYSAIGITILSALYQGIINIIGLGALVVFTSITYVYFNFPQLNKVIRALLFISISVCFVAFAFHKVPGFFNVIAINKLQLSESSIPFSMYLNFDKVLPALIIFVLSDLCVLEKQQSIGVVKYTLLPLLACIIIVIILALTSGYALFEPKLPEILPIWAINNFFFVCMAEEVFFRGFIQRTLQNFLPKQQILAVIIATLIFGAAHFRGGLTYIALSSMCGFFNGYTYYKTNKILCTMIVHFGLNLFHLLLFTYPALIKTI